ncbi:MAG: ATP-binding protein [Flavobacteriales bacterium]|nr:ATP-binding protein [Flavobacteriales bacterium]
MKRIAITGPESSGKTTLARALAAHFGVPWVPEFAREYLKDLDRPYVKEDLLRIAEGQLEAERRIASGRPSMLVCDTDLLVIRIWSQEKFERVDPRLEELVRGTEYHHTLLCKPDLPWEPDPLRENPHDRDRLFGIYEQELNALGRTYAVIQGERMERLHRAVHALSSEGELGSSQ